MADAIRHHLSSRWAGEMGWLGPLLCLPADPDRDRSPNWPFMYHVAGFADAAAHEAPRPLRRIDGRSEEHTSELQSLMRISYAVFCLKKKKIICNKLLPH